jgi:hypothetical protein
MEYYKSAYYIGFSLILSVFQLTVTWSTQRYVVLQGAGAVMSFLHDASVKWHNDLWWGRLNWRHIRLFRHIQFWSKTNLSALASYLRRSTPEDGTNRLSRNVGNKSPLPCCVITQNSAVWTYLSAIVSGNLAEWFITVDNWEVDDLSVGQ